jgi:CRISPR-associated protein Csb1
MNAPILTQMVTEDAALRRRQRLQPVGGKGDKIFPPTYPGEGPRNPPPRHVFERRRIDGNEVWCVLVDSVQSQANRLEESLLGAIRDGVQIPHVVVDFKEKGLDGISKITSLDAPHRVYDAILRDSFLDNQPFMKSATGERITKASNHDASAVLEISPTALLFGSWHSTGEGGGIGAKFARCLVSEIVAIEVPVNMEDARGRDSSFVIVAGDSLRIVEPITAGRRTGSRIDPLGITKSVEIYKQAGADDWTPNREQAEMKGKEPVLYSRKKGDKAGKPSVINHGNIAPSVQSLGITCDYLEHMFVLSFAGLRRLSFGSPEKNTAGRVLLAALGLLAITEQDEQGYALRSRCDLVCEGKAPLEVVHPDGTTENIALGVQEARALYAEAFDAAKNAGFEFADGPLRLTPQDKLVEIVRKSQELALQGKGGDEQNENTGSEV